MSSEQHNGALRGPNEETAVTFTTLLAEIAATYPEQPRKFHVLATRYYLGAEGNAATFRARMTTPIPVGRDFHLRPYLTTKQTSTIIENR